MTIIRYMWYNPNATINDSHWFECAITDETFKGINDLDAMTMIKNLIVAMRKANEKDNSNYDIAITSIEFEA